MADKEMYISSIIDVDLWNSAGWKGVGLLFTPGNVAPPAFAFMFQNIEAGKKIFQGLRQRVGPVDKFEELRLSIIEGDIPGEMPGYTVHFGPDLDNILKRAKSENIDLDPEYVLAISRIHRMNPPSTSTNLSNFKKSYEKFREYDILPMDFSGNPQPIFDLAIHKKSIHFRQVNEVRENDIDSVIFKK